MISQWCFEGKWQSLCSGLIASSPRLIARQIVFFPKSSSYPSFQSRNLNKTKIAQNVLEWVDSHNALCSYPLKLEIKKFGKVKAQFSLNFVPNLKISVLTGKELYKI